MGLIAVGVVQRPICLQETRAPSLGRTLGPLQVLDGQHEGYVESAMNNSKKRKRVVNQPIRLSMADQRCLAQALLSPPKLAPALERAFSRHNKLFRTE